MTRCPSCGRENADNFNFCLDCGQELKKAAPPPAPVSPAPHAPWPQNIQPVPPPQAQPRQPIQLTGAKMPPSIRPIPVPPMPQPQPIPQHAPQPPPAIRPIPVPPMPVSTSAPSLHPHPPAPQPPPVAPPPVQAAPKAAEQPCPNCGKPVPVGFSFCGFCGKRFSGAGTEEVKKTMFIHAVSAVPEKKYRGRLIAINPDGTEGMMFNLKTQETVTGRSQGVILLSDDKFVSPRHAKFAYRANSLFIIDENSLNGIYVKLRGETSISCGTMFRIGRQLLKFETTDRIEKMEEAKSTGDDTLFLGSPDAGYWGRLVQAVEGGKVGRVFPLKGDEVLIGRVDGEIQFQDDGFVSSRHAVVGKHGGEFFIRDLGSSNGTYMRVNREEELLQDDFVLMGNKLLRVDSI